MNNSIKASDPDREDAARAETVALLDDLKERLAKAEGASEQHQKQAEVLQSRLDDALKEQAKLEEKVHENEEQIETLRNERREAARQMREMEAIYEAERSAMTKEKEDMGNREEEMQRVIQRLKDSLAQRTTANGDDEIRPSRQCMWNSPSYIASAYTHTTHTPFLSLSYYFYIIPLLTPNHFFTSIAQNNSPSVDNGSFAPPSSLNRSDSRNNSKLVLQKDKLIESLRLELAEAQIKLVESENQGGGRLHEVERLLMEARMANARLMEDNESYQLLLQEKTLKGDFATSDFSYMSGGSNGAATSNQDALNALEGRSGGGTSLADELSEATESESGDNYRRLEAELRGLKEQNKALTLYINRIIERLLQHKDFEHILDQSSDSKPPDTNKELPEPPNKQATGPWLLQRAKSMAVSATSGSKPRPRPMSVMPSTNSALNNPDTAPSIPIGLTRSSSVRRSRPMSEQYTGGAGAAGIVNAMYKGMADGGPLSPTLRGSQAAFFGSPSSSAGGAGGHRVSSGTGPGGVPLSSSGNFPGMRSETSSTSGDSVAGTSGDVTTPPSQSPPRPGVAGDKATTLAGNKPRPLRLVQENPGPDAANKRASWVAWAFGKKDDAGPLGSPDSIKE